MQSKLRRKQKSRRPVLGLPPAVAKAKTRPVRKRPPGPAQGAAPRAAEETRALAHASTSRALEIFFEDAIADGEGFSVGCVGAPRFGKSYLLNQVIDAARTKGLADVVLIHDVKKAGKPQYEGAVCAGLDDFAANGERYANERVIVFNSTDWMRQPTLDEVCEVAMAIHDDGMSVLVVADEVYKGTNGFGQWLPGRDDKPALFPLFLREGTSQRISTAWTTQIPQELPTACKVLTRAVAQFHLESLAADAATEKFRLDADGPQVLRGLQRGEFVLYCQGREWDRTIYGP